MFIIFRKAVFIVLIFVIHSAMAVKQNEIFHRSFWQPVYLGLPLNYCTLDGRECGLAVASRYCQLMGYARADQQIIANNAGLTRYISTTAKCRGWQCNSFKTIRCSSAISHNPPAPYYYRLKSFVYPRYNHYRVDWCYDGKTGCGKRAAHSFCRRLGYMDVKSFTIQRRIAATQAIGNQKLCFGSECNAFAEINCFR